MSGLWHKMFTNQVLQKTTTQSQQVLDQLHKTHQKVFYLNINCSSLIAAHSGIWYYQYLAHAMHFRGCIDGCYLLEENKFERELGKKCEGVYM